jgi:anti-sigma regulatory factor (Ser/Thr protein kinase)
VCWQRVQTYDGDELTPRRARQFAVSALTEVLGPEESGADGDDAIQDVALVVSELVTNSIRAHASAVMLSVDIHHSHVRIAVEDDAPGTPQMVPVHSSRPNGRGLSIVSQLSTGWGVQPVPAGKQVWAEVAVRKGALIALRCDYPIR